MILTVNPKLFKSMKIKPLLLAILCLTAISTLSLAQITTSTLAGRVIDTSGEAVVGAVVASVHEPSGTRYAAVTNLDGRFSIQGMRVGGPYRVEVSYLGAETAVHTGITLELGGTYVLDTRLAEADNRIEAVVVSASASKFETQKTGPSVNITGTRMRLMPTISRSIEDMARLSPYANGMGFAGGDGRSTNFTVDGANFNNNFGLNEGLPGGGNPISLESIEEIQVVVAPFDVRQTNFIGGGINAITKSGTNTFRGSAYTYYQNQDMRGNRVEDFDFGARAKESTSVYGATFGGPIVKNKLFFFGNIEYEKSPTQVIRWRASQDGVSDNQTISRTTDEDMRRVSEHLKTKYGYDTGSWRDFPADESGLKYLLRLDWNIHRNHKFNVRYNHTESTQWVGPNGNSNDVGWRSPDNRVSKSSMAYANSMYSQVVAVNSLSAELNSRFGDRVSNQLLFTYSQIRDPWRGSPSSIFPFIDIMGNDLGDETFTSYIAAGYELFSWNNGVRNNVTTLTDNFTIALDRHKLTAGLSYEHQYANNTYIRSGTGYYRYASVSDFLNDAAPVDFALTFGTNGNKVPANAVDFDQFGFYVQDEWDVNPRFKLTVGVRGDLLSFRNNIITNNAIKALDFGGRRIDTGVWPRTRINMSPRAGFTWDAVGDRSLIVRGGTGLFTGRLPLVFLTNMPTNSGMTQSPFSIVSPKDNNGQPISIDPKLIEAFQGGMATTVEEMMRRLGISDVVTPDKGMVGSTVAAVDPDFKMPQVWKTALGVDYQIPAGFPFTATAEAMYTKNINAVMLDNYAINSAASGTWERFSGSDNRLIYPSGNGRFYDVKQSNGGQLENAHVLVNTDKGYGYTLNLTLRAQPARNLDVMAAYTHTEMREITGMPGNAAASAWQGLPTVDGPNMATLQRSQYVIPDQVIGSVSYTLPDVEWKSSTFSLFYRGYSPYGNSYMYDNDMNGDRNGNDLMYIPKGRGDIRFVTPEDENAFFAYMEQDKYLSAHKGEYAGAYAARAPWVHRFDFRFIQDFRIKAGGQTNTIQLSLDILNVGNMLNSKWGVRKSMSGSNNGRVLRYEGMAEGTTTPTFSMVKVNGQYPTQTWSRLRNYSECWGLQIGIRYLFN